MINDTPMLLSTLALAATTSGCLGEPDATDAPGAELGSRGVAFSIAEKPAAGRCADSRQTELACDRVLAQVNAELAGVELGFGARDAFVSHRSTSAWLQPLPRPFPIAPYQAAVEVDPWLTETLDATIEEIIANGPSDEAPQTLRASTSPIAEAADGSRPLPEEPRLVALPALPPTRACPVFFPVPSFQYFRVTSLDDARLELESDALDRRVAVGVETEGALDALRLRSTVLTPLADARLTAPGALIALPCIDSRPPVRPTVERVAAEVRVRLVVALDWAPTVRSSPLGTEVGISPRVSASVLLRTSDDDLPRQVASFGTPLTSLFTDQGLSEVWDRLGERPGRPVTLEPALGEQLPDLDRPFVETQLLERLQGYGRDLEDELMDVLREALELDANDERTFFVEGRTRG